MTGPGGTIGPGRRGIALVVAVVTLAVIGALVTVALFGARSDRHGSSLVFEGEAAGQAAQAGLDAAAAGFDRTWLRLGPGRSSAIAPTSLGTGRAFYAGSVTRLNSVLWMVRTVGAVLAPDGDTLSVRWAGTLFKKLAPDLAPGAAVTVSGSAVVDRSALLDGADTDPIDGAWPASCAGGSRRSVPGLRAGGDATLAEPGNVVPSAVVGDTSVVLAMSAVDTAFERLAATPDIVIGPDPVVAPLLETDQSCATGAVYPGNWGDPDHRMPAVGGYPCGDYFPVISFDGPELRLTGAVGQGILLVNGDLRIGPGVSFYGVVLVRGRVVAPGGDSEIRGALIARDVVLGSGSESGGGVVFTYSTCAIATALDAAADAQPIAQRSFVQY